MRLTTGRAKLKHSFENLMLRWADVCAGWDDPARRNFDDEHLAPLAPDLQATLRAIDRLAATLSQMESECG